MVAHHFQPGAFDELEQAAGGTRLGLGIGLEAAFLAGLRNQIGEIHAGPLAGLAQRGEEFVTHLMPADAVAVDDLQAGGGGWCNRGHLPIT
jgi:hypothetical protein